MHEELPLAVLGEVQDFGTQRAADRGDRGLDRVHLRADDSRVEIAPPPWNRPRHAGDPVDLEQVVARRVANGVAWLSDRISDW